MEQQMKGICDGRLAHREVVHEIMEQYKHVYMRSTTRIDILKGVSIGSDLKVIPTNSPDNQAVRKYVLGEDVG